MARKTETYVVSEEGRDKGKTFILTEMSATKAEDWAFRALLALGGANGEVPNDLPSLGMATIAEIGIKKLFALPFQTLKPLADELMECVQIVPDTQRPQVRRALIESDIEEVATRVKLKWKVLGLHLDFLPPGVLSGLKPPQTPGEGRRIDAPTSPAPSL